MAYSAQQQISLLRQLTAKTGAIHEAQMLQLRCWGVILFTGHWELYADFDSKKIRYDLVDEPVLEIDPNLLKLMDSSIPDLLGDDWSWSYTTPSQRI